MAQLSTGCRSIGPPPAEGSCLQAQPTPSNPPHPALPSLLRLCKEAPQPHLHPLRPVFGTADPDLFNRAQGYIDKSFSDVQEMQAVIEAPKTRLVDLPLENLARLAHLRNPNVALAQLGGCQNSKCIYICTYT